MMCVARSAAGGKTCTSVGAATLCLAEQAAGAAWVREELDKRAPNRRLRELVDRSGVLVSRWLFEAVETGTKPRDKKNYAIGREED
jgi:hypothetical protein